MIESVRLILNGVPKEIDIVVMRKYFLGLKGVYAIQNLHVWAISTTEIDLTVHLVIPKQLVDEHFYVTVREDLFHKYQISHSTIQVEKKELGLDYCSR